MTADVHRLAFAVAGYGLAGSMACWPDSPLDERLWRGLADIVRKQRLSGMLVQAIQNGALPVTDQQAELASEDHWNAVCSSLMLESALLRVVDVLGEAGVPARVLKGSAVAHLDYGDASTRLFGDNDLLVKGEDFDRAVAALVADGNVRRFPEPRPGFDRRFSKGTSFVMPDGTEIDLHRTFVMGPYGLRLKTEDLWRSEATFTLAGRQLSALDDSCRFLHACFHAALGNIEPRLVPQRDVAQMLLGPRFQLDQVRALMAAWQAEAVVAKAVSLAWTTFQVADVTALSAWAGHYRADAREVKELAVYSDPEGSYAGKSLAALRALPSMRDKAAFVLALALPQREYRQDRHTGPFARLRKGAVAAMHRSGR